MVVPFDIPHLPDVTGRDEIDRDPFTTETTGSANPVNVVGSLHRQVKIDDQINCPILENILEKMLLVRRKAITSDTKGEPVDNIEEFFSSKRLKTQMGMNADARFSLDFQNRLSKDYEKMFKKIATKINSTRSESEVHGEELKDKVLEWTKWANFRNRIAKHLNKFALSASNEGNKSNVIKLIRYANIYDKKIS